ncbi:uncharacterized protein LOC124672973 [Lolium rigidum]|uniref:uncharacterized protein LOC124672973 n=1 Tax=Lolium rigidum TaxID=89674 RepID=UPI001F5CDB8A|nr:uncharacterized protein LOC124672973 [Lolium rigidum]
MSPIQMLNSPGLKSISGLCSAFSLHLFGSRCWWTTAASGGAWWVLPSHRHDFSHAGDWQLGNAAAIEPKVAERQSSQLRKTTRRDGAAPRPSAPLPLAACPCHKSSHDLLVLLDEMVILLGFGALWASSLLVLVTLSAPASRFLLASSQDGRLLFRRRSWY